MVKRIKKLCSEHGITISYLERVLKIGNGVISRWDESSPRLDTVQKVASWFGMTVSDLIEEGGESLAVTAFGKEVKRKLLDLDQNQTWLIEEVRKKTGLYFDSSYMHKILTGKIATPKIMSAIREILGMEEAA